MNSVDYRLDPTDLLLMITMCIFLPNIILGFATLRGIESLLLQIQTRSFYISNKITNRCDV